MTSLTLSDKDLATLRVDALVVGVARSADGPVLVPGPTLPRPLRTMLAGALGALGVTGEADQVIRVPSGKAVAAPVVVLTGLGAAVSSTGRRRATYPHEALRRAAGAATRSLAGTGTVALALPTPDAAALTAVAEGALLGAYAFTLHRGATASDVPAPVRAVTVVTDLGVDSATKAVVTRATRIAEAVHLTRDLVNTAPGDLPPTAFVQAAQKAARGTRVSMTVLDEKALTRGGYGGILGVGMGSTRPPRLLRVDYAPRGAKAHLAFVGKGITFDSGGLSLKTAAGMETMKSDMAGAAAVVASVLAIARLGVKVRVTGWAPLAENMPSGSAQRPSDVLTTFGGRTVEVLNTDAEGRLVLADALVAASQEQPDAIVDVATLTGAQIAALGTRCAAVMGNDDDLRAQVHAVADRVGEQVWPMPLPAELRPGLDSQVADIANMGDRFGGMLVAGLFLKEFVGTRDGSADGATGTPIPWAHLDIAGPSFNDSAAWGYTPKGGTGFAVRTLVALAEERAARA